MEVFASLSVTSSQMSTTKIGASIGAQCDRCWAAGDVREKTIIKEKKNGWRIVCHSESVDDIQQPINDLFRRIHGAEDKIAALTSCCEVLIRCAVYSKDVPSLYLDASTLQKLAGITASFDIDLYLS